MSDKNAAQNTSAHNATPVELSKIHVPYDWNSRAERNVKDMADTENAGFEGFRSNIAAQGQVTPVILRNTNGKLLSGAKTDKPFELLVGFRRTRAITELNSGEFADKAKKDKRPCVPGLPDGTLLAEVRTVDDPVAARILNGVENTGRKNLKAQDMLFLVKSLADAGLNQTAIAEALVITQGWVSKLLKVGTLPAAVLSHWRNNTAIPPVQTKDGVFGLTDAQCKEVKRELTEPDMRGLAELKSGPEELTARYIRMVRPEAQGDGPGAVQPTTDKVKEEVEYIAGLMGCMVRAGVLDNGSLDWNRVIGPKKKGYPIDCGKDDGQERLLELGDAARDAFEREVSKGAKGAEAKAAVQPSTN